MSFSSIPLYELGKAVARYEISLGLEQIQTQDIYSFRYSSRVDLEKLVRRKGNLLKKITANRLKVFERLHSDTVRISSLDEVVLQSMVMDCDRAIETISSQVLVAECMLKSACMSSEG